MRKTFLREKENAAKIQLITIGEQDTSYEQRWLNSPALKISKSQSATRERVPKTKTQLPSPSCSMGDEYRENLKSHLLELKRKIPGETAQLPRESYEAREMKSYPLKPRIFNNESIRKVEELYLNKQQSEQKMRPITYVANSKFCEEEEQEKLRTIIKRKIMAKDLFRKLKLQEKPEIINHTEQATGSLLRNLSHKPSIKRNILAFKHKNLLPHIH